VKFPLDIHLRDLLACDAIGLVTSGCYNTDGISHWVPVLVEPLTFMEDIVS